LTEYAYPFHTFFTPRHKDVLGVEVWLHAFLTLALDGGE